MVNEVLARGDLSSHLYPAIEVLYAYAQHDIRTLASSDIYLPALVGVHHASTLFAGMGLPVDSTVKSFGGLAHESPEVGAAIMSSLASLLNSTATVVS